METKKKAKAKTKAEESKTVTIRLPLDVYTDVQNLAKRDIRTFNLEVTYLLKRGLSSETSSDK